MQLVLLQRLHDGLSSCRQSWTLRTLVGWPHVDVVGREDRESERLRAQLHSLCAGCALHRKCTPAAHMLRHRTVRCRVFLLDGMSVSRTCDVSHQRAHPGINAGAGASAAAHLRNMWLRTGGWRQRQRRVNVRSTFELRCVALGSARGMASQAP